MPYEYTTEKLKNSTKVLYKSQVVVGEIIKSPGGHKAIDYRSVSHTFTFEGIAIGWIIARSKRRKSREKVCDTEQVGRLNFSAWI